MKFIKRLLGLGRANKSTAITNPLLRLHINSVTNTPKTYTNQN